MRIGQFIDTPAVGGAETLVLELCGALRERGHEPVLLHFGNRHLERQCAARGIEAWEVPHHRLYKSARRLPLFIWYFSRYLRALRLDAVHSHLLGAVGATAVAARLAGVRHVGTLHDTYSLRDNPAYLHLLRLAAWLGPLVAVSEEMRRFFYDRGGFGARLRTIHNGVRLPPTEERGPLRRALGVAADAVVITCVARLVPLKAHTRLLAAFAHLEEPRAVLLCAGDGPLREPLQQQARELGISGRVRFLGNRDDVPQLLRASDLFVLASDTEGLSCSLLEAMAAGLPAVATRVGGNPELVVDGATGILVPPGEVDALRAALSRLASDAPLRGQMGARAAERAREGFSFDAMTARYEALYGA